MPENQHRNAKTEEALYALQNGWFEIFGVPKILRHDPEGCFSSDVFTQAMSEMGIQLGTTAGEAHWQLGITERMIQTIFKAAERIHSETGVDMQTAVSLSVKSK